MTRNVIISVLLVVLVALGALLFYRLRAPDEMQAVRAAVDAYLATKSSLIRNAMDFNVVGFSNTGNQGEAQVEFRAKTGGGSFQITYELARQGKGWVVTGSKGMGLGAHPGAEQPPASALPPAHPAANPPSSNP
ncbi:MAG: hypothetical protein ACRD50_04115 [Candidatus Acidiferrales bacterium]